MVVQHNLTAMNANRYLGINNSKLSKSLEKLSSGYAINRAGDNAAGLAVSEKMRSQIAGMTQGVKNAQDGISMVQTFEGALTETDSILQRMKTLADQMANGTYDDPVDRTAAQQEFLQLNDELDQIADTDFNGVVVLNGGKMADGTKAIAGKIDYSDKSSARDPKTLSAGDFTVGEAKGAVTTNETVTFTYTDNGDGTGSWTQSGGTDANFNSHDTGGFDYDGYVFTTENSNLVTGDTVTIDFKVDTAEQVATAANGGYTYTGVAKDPLGNVTVADVDPTSKTMAENINRLQGAEISFTTDATGKVNKIDTKGATILTLKDGTQIKAGDKASATNPYEATFGDNGVLSIKVWDGTAAAEVFAIAAGTATTDNASSKGTITLAFDEAIYNPKVQGGYKFSSEGVTVSKSDAFKKSEAQLTYKDSITLQTGARTKDAVNFTFQYASDAIGDLKADLNCTAKGLGTDKLNLSTQENANYAIDKIDQAINKVSLVRGTFGAIQNRLEHKIDNMNVSIENLTSAESQIRDTNMPQEMMNFTKQQILAQASQSMLAQANQLPQSVLSLLQ